MTSKQYKVVMTLKKFQGKPITVNRIVKLSGVSRNVVYVVIRKLIHNNQIHRQNTGKRKYKIYQFQSIKGVNQNLPTINISNHSYYIVNPFSMLGQLMGQLGLSKATKYLQTRTKQVQNLSGKSHPRKSIFNRHSYSVKHLIFLIKHTNLSHTQILKKLHMSKPTFYKLLKKLNLYQPER